MPGFKNASLVMKEDELVSADLKYMYQRFWTTYKTVFNHALDHRVEGEELTVKVKSGEFEATIMLTQGRGYSRDKSSGNGGNGDDQKTVIDFPVAKAVIESNIDELSEVEDAGDFYWIGTKKKMSNWESVNQKLRSAGFMYVKWEKGEKYSGGWRADK